MSLLNSGIEVPALVIGARELIPSVRLGARITDTLHSVAVSSEGVPPISTRYFRNSVPTLGMLTQAYRTSEQFRLSIAHDTNSIELTRTFLDGDTLIEDPEYVRYENGRWVPYLGKRTILTKVPKNGRILRYSDTTGMPEETVIDDPANMPKNVDLSRFNYEKTGGLALVVRLRRHGLFDIGTISIPEIGSKRIGCRSYRVNGNGHK
jgi:hypothetical protein